MQESARAGGIHHKLSRKLQRLGTPGSSQEDAVFPLGYIGEFDLIPIRHSQGLRLFDKILIEVRTIPMRVGDGFVRTGADHELAAPAGIGLERAAKFVMIKGEASF